MSVTLESAAYIVGRPVLQENPFPEAVTGRNEAVLVRLAALAGELKAKIEGDLKRLHGGAEDSNPEDWELAALERSLHEWRVYEAFRQLHEQRWCPALLFRLSTKTDLLTLCNPAAGSSAAGFDERTKKVLTKRGIDHRFKWREARQMISTMGLIQLSGAVGDGYAGTTEAAAEVHPNEGNATNHTPTSTSEVPEAPSSGEPDPVQEAQTSETQPGQQDESGSPADLPVLRLDHVWSALPSYTKAQLEAVYTRMACGLWTQFADRFYSSFKKAEMLGYVRRLVRFHANVEAVQHLTDRQLDTFFDWMRSHLNKRSQREDDLRIAARLLQDMLRMADLGLLSADAWNRYRDAEVRRIGAFCYHRFYRERTDT